MGTGRSRTAVVVALGTTQALAWASSVYLPAVLADPVAATTGMSRDGFFGAYSAALLISALVSPAAGRMIDRRGGRGVLAVSNLVLAAGLLLLVSAPGAAGVIAGWAVLGVGMALGLYEAAFATLAGLYGRAARGPITGVTLIGGFASTIGWPLTSALVHAFGWRTACGAWAAAHLLIGLPIHLSLPRAALRPAAAPVAASAAAPVAAGAAPALPRRPMVQLMIAFGAAAFVTSAIAAHGPRVLLAAGLTPAAAIATAALVGPAQVTARLLEFAILRRLSAAALARLATSLHPIGAASLLLLGTRAGAAFAILHGAGNGMLTIARGTLPLALFGADGFGARTGVIAVPARLMQAAAPVVFGVVLDRFGLSAALAVSAGLSGVALLALARVAPPA